MFHESGLREAGADALLLVCLVGLWGGGAEGRAERVFRGCDPAGEGGLVKIFVRKEVEK